MNNKHCQGHEKPYYVVQIDYFPNGNLFMDSTFVLEMTLLFMRYTFTNQKIGPLVVNLSPKKALGNVGNVNSKEF